MQLLIVEDLLSQSDVGRISSFERAHMSDWGIACGLPLSLWVNSELMSFAHVGVCQKLRVVLAVSLQKDMIIYVRDSLLALFVMAVEVATVAGRAYDSEFLVVGFSKRSVRAGAL